MNILIATGNEGKKAEIRQFFRPDSGVKFVSLKDFDFVEEPEEDGKTFEANALIKARYYGENHNIPTLAEDSGLILEAFPEKFGLKTRRELSAKDDMDWLDQFLEMIRDTENKKATFYSSIAFFDPIKKIEQAVLGVTSGEIVDFPQAPIEKGIPVSSVFIPEGSSEVFAAMTKEQKNAVSHRGKAVAAFSEWFAENY